MKWRERWRVEKMPLSDACVYALISEVMPLLVGRSAIVTQSHLWCINISFNSIWMRIRFWNCFSVCLCVCKVHTLNRSKSCRKSLHVSQILQESVLRLKALITNHNNNNNDNKNNNANHIMQIRNKIINEENMIGK